MNEIKNQTNQTPIEIALGIDTDGKTTARNLYEFLELDKSQYARWYKSNILENPFAIENEDYDVLDINVENPKGGRPTQNFKLSANFAKKLSMQGKTEKAEQARDYFITVEKKLKEAATVLKLPKLISMDEVEKKEPYARLFKTDSGGIVLMNDMVYNLAQSEMEHLSRFVSELEKQSIGHMPYVVSSFLKSMKKSRKLEETASWGVKQEEEQKPLLQNKERGYFMLKTTKTTTNQSYNCPGTNHLLKPVNVALYDIPQITDEKWNELAEQNKMLHNDRIIVNQIGRLINSVAAGEDGKGKEAGHDI